MIGSTVDLVLIDRLRQVLVNRLKLRKEKAGISLFDLWIYY